MVPSEIDPEAPIGAIATTHPAAVEVFQRRGIPFGRHGRVSLAEVCRLRGLDPAEVSRAIVESAAEPRAAATRWDERPLDELVGHIVETHHDPMRGELERLEALCDDISDAVRGLDPRFASALVEALGYVKREQEQHLLKEECVVFRMILHDAGYVSRVPLDVLTAEHDMGDLLLTELLQLLADAPAVVTARAGEALGALRAGLTALQRDLEVHTHLENNVLFPRAITGRIVA